MSAAARIVARYDTPDARGETRRQLNARFGFDAPDAAIRPADAVLWRAFCEVAGSDDPLTAARLADWREMHGGRLCRDQVLALVQIDRAYRAAVAAERAEQRSRETK